MATLKGIPGCTGARALIAALATRTQTWRSPASGRAGELVADHLNAMAIA
jgi:hypothetical protein